MLRRLDWQFFEERKKAAKDIHEDKQRQKRKGVAATAAAVATEDLLLQEPRPWTPNC